jgi:hypothetical protein
VYTNISTAHHAHPLNLALDHLLHFQHQPIYFQTLAYIRNAAQLPENESGQPIGIPPINCSL